MLRGEWQDVREHCWADNTIKTRRSQWNKFFKFCIEFHLEPLPASPETVCLYITFLVRSCCYVTIANYISGLWALHDFWGFRHVESSMFLIKSTLMGAKRLLGCETVQAPPLSPQDLKKLWLKLDMNKFSDLQLWAAITLAYRCLLRVSHLVTSPHMLQVKDISFTREGVDVTIRSSKTVQFRERTQLIPIIKAENSVLCPCRFLWSYVQQARLHPTSQLFPYSYSKFASLFKKLCSSAGLVGNYTTHSMRRGSATFLASFLPLHDVKSYGDWRSWSVLLYISDNYASRKIKDELVAQKLAAV